MPRIARPTRRILAALPATGLAITMLGACGGGGAATADTAVNTGTQEAATTPGGAGTDRATGARTAPGASGKIAEVSGSTMQVQNISTQTAVSWTKDTKFTDTVSAKSSDLAVGDCISVTPATTTTTTTTDETAPVAAASISISDAVNGACGLGGGGGGGGGGGLRGGQPPTAGQAPTDAQRPDGAGQGARGGLRGASGKVVSLSGDTINVEMTRPAMANGTATAAPSTGTATTTSRTVTFTSSTTWTQIKSAESDAIKVGRCVTALGTAASTGVVTATSIVIRSATDGECTGAIFDRQGMGRGQNGGLAGAPASTQAGA